VFITVSVFVQQFFLGNPEAFINAFALIPAKINWDSSLTLVAFGTAIFLHGGIFHILSNMWFLWVFGDDVEGYLPPFVFLLLYFCAGVIGNVAQYWLQPDSTIPILGASGAIAGVLGCYFVFFPYSKIRTLVFLFIFVTVVDISAPLMLGYWFLLQLFSGAMALPFTNTEGGIAFFAHAAGFLVGVLFGLLFKHQAQMEERVIEGEVI
jgi:membrane associated rhomboid family serine protease